MRSVRRAGEAVVREAAGACGAARIARSAAAAGGGVVPRRANSEACAAEELWCLGGTRSALTRRATTASGARGITSNTRRAHGIGVVSGGTSACREARRAVLVWCATSARDAISRRPTLASGASRVALLAPQRRVSVVAVRACREARVVVGMERRVVAIGITRRADRGTRGAATAAGSAR